MKREDIFPMYIGTSYLVYAWGIFVDHPWYCICDENHTEIPFWRPGGLFEVSDQRLSRYWKYWEGAHHRAKARNFPVVECAFLEWGQQLDFYDKLTDRIPGAVEIFDRYRAKMDVEFPHPDISTTAEILEGNWVSCPQCSDTWEAQVFDGMTKCKKCSIYLINPIFIDITDIRNIQKFKNIKTSNLNT